jgi:hypothetical protein
MDVNLSDSGDPAGLSPTKLFKDCPLLGGWQV